MRLKFEKSSIFLIIIALLLAGFGVGFYVSLMTDSITDAIKNDRIIKILFVIEDEGKPIATEVLFYYPPTHRSAIFDIPGETGLIIKTLERVDRIDVLFDPKDPRPYKNLIENLMATEIPNYLVVNMENFSNIVDLLDGLDLFIPNPIDIVTDTQTTLLPSGAVNLDGRKMRIFASFSDPEEPEIDRITRKQKAFQSLLKRLGERSSYITMARVFPHLRANIRTNLEQVALKRLIDEIAKLDAERLVPQRISGTKKTVEGKAVLFPHYDGELLKDIVKQTLNALANSSALPEGERVFTVEILNGTAIQGLAKKTAELFQSFGYEVVSIDNADNKNYLQTTVFDRLGNSEAAGNVANVIRCKNVRTGNSSSATEFTVDFSIILGKDFNGRYVLD